MEDSERTEKKQRRTPPRTGRRRAARGSEWTEEVVFTKRRKPKNLLSQPEGCLAAGSFFLSLFRMAVHNSPWSGCGQATLPPLHPWFHGRDYHVDVFFTRVVVVVVVLVLLLSLHSSAARKRLLFLFRDASLSFFFFSFYFLGSFAARSPKLRPRPGRYFLFASSLVSLCSGETRRDATSETARHTLLTPKKQENPTC